VSKGPHGVAITCRGADADVLAEVLVDARQCWAASRTGEMTEIERERVRSAVGVIDDVLLQLQSSVSSPVRRPQPRLRRDAAAIEPDGARILDTRKTTPGLVARDFARGVHDDLPSGQAIPQRLGCPVIPAQQINPTNDTVFNTDTPLLYYVLAEAQRSDQTLGCVGARIVEEVFLRVLWQSPNSILRNGFVPDPSLVRIRPEGPACSFGDLLVDTGLVPRSS
jgi:hypothetical protein